MSVNSIKKLSSVASGNGKKIKKIEKNALLKPIKQTKVDEEDKKSLSERFNEAISAGLKTLEEKDNQAVEQLVTKEVSMKRDSAAASAGEDNTVESEAEAPDGAGAELPEASDEKEEGNTITNVNDLILGLEKIVEDFKGVTDADYIPDEYKVDVPENLNLSKVDVPEVDEEKVREEITNAESLATKKAKEEKTSVAESAIEKLLSSIETAKAGAGETDSKINKIYDNYKLTQESEAIKRGLARSSVALLALDGIEAARAEELSESARALGEQISATEKEITNLQVELSNALSNLDLELSVNINNKVAEKLKELNKARAEAIEFNNNVSKLEAEYQTKRADKLDEAAKLEAMVAEKYKGAAEADKSQKMFDLAFKYYNNMDQTAALKEIIKTPVLLTLLGNRYYDLYYKIMRK